jgi:hypothetical protein
MQRAGATLLGAALVIGAGWGALKLSQKFPAKSKNAAIAVQAGAGLVIGGGLAAAGYPTAGAISAVTFGSNALRIATETPNMAGLLGTQMPIAGLLPTMRGMDDGDDYGSAMSGADAQQAQINGLIAALRT